MPFVFTRTDDGYAASEQFRIHGIGSRSEQGERSGVEYWENIEGVARVRSKEQTRCRKRACNHGQVRRQKACAQ